MINVPKRIEDYAMIGDGQTIALVSRTGAIDWLCLPRFDSDACFASLLGNEEHGSWAIAPDGTDFSVKRRYCGDTLVLETEFKTERGACLVTDFMPIRQGKHPAVIRIVSGMDGELAMRMTLKLRFDFGAMSPWFTENDGVIIGKVGPDLVVIRADAPLVRDNDTILAQFNIKCGQQIIFALQHGESTGPIPPALDTQTLLRGTKAWWLDWISTFRRETEWPELVRRSLIVLKALTYFPTGGIVAAGTAGLPEKPSGRMNWDYRYCWLRDSTFTLTALLNAGFSGEAEAWLRWLLRAVAGTPDRIRIAYRVDGGRHLAEWNADWLPGYECARPVRIGNQAAQQRQLDVFGEIIDSSYLAERAGLDRDGWEVEVERRLVLRIADIWREPDHGFWESRGRPRHYVYSKVMAWVGIDRFLKLKRAKEHCDGALRARLETLHRKMHDEICRRGYSEKRQSFVSYYGSLRVDPSLLLLPLVGFLPVEDPRISGTIAAVEQELLEGGLVRRGRPKLLRREEGCFLACACWLADCMVMQGRQEEARRLLGRVADVANDVGLMAEEYHVREQRLLGNFPQALSHLAFVNAVLGLTGDVLQRGGG